MRYISAMYDLDANKEIAHEEFEEWGKEVVDAIYKMRYDAWHKMMCEGGNYNSLLFNEVGEIIIGFDT